MNGQRLSNTNNGNREALLCSPQVHRSLPQTPGSLALLWGLPLWLHSVLFLSFQGQGMGEAGT